MLTLSGAVCLSDTALSGVAFGYKNERAYGNTSVA